MKITYLTGDATYPQTPGQAIIAHICNDVGAWGSGFVLAVSARWKKPEECYRSWCRSEENFALGQTQLVPVDEGLFVMNMISQSGLIGPNNPRPLRYGSLQLCLEKLAAEAVNLGASVHMPRIGCGRAGGKWEDIEPLIAHALSDNGIPVFVYDI